MKYSRLKKDNKYKNLPCKAHDGHFNHGVENVHFYFDFHLLIKFFQEMIFLMVQRGQTVL